MNISRKKSAERKSQIKTLFFYKKIKQKIIAKELWIALRTVEDYIKKIKKDD